MPLYKEEFFKKYNIKEQELERAGLEWNELEKIYDNYIDEIKELKILASFIEESLFDIRKIHSIKKRVKDPGHLIRKIIRKKVDNPSMEINVNNYKDIITDLIGVRILHLFKDDWSSIHDEIVGKWNMKETPIANIREGDRTTLINQFKEKGLDIKEHYYGYRSIHYQIRFIHNKKEMTAEIQVRTLIEEAWSEIDHKMRYPNNIHDTVLSEYLVIFNRLAGSADEMGSFIKILKQEIDVNKKELDEKTTIIKELQEEINNSKLDRDEKEKIMSNLQRLGVLEAIKSAQKILMESRAFNEAAAHAHSGDIREVKITNQKGEEMLINKELIDEATKIAEQILQNNDEEDLKNVDGSLIKPGEEKKREIIKDEGNRAIVDKQDDIFKNYMSYDDDL